MLATLFGSHLSREPTASPVLTKQCNQELTLATSFGSHAQMVAKFGGQILATKFGFVPDWLMWMKCMPLYCFWMLWNKQCYLSDCWYYSTAMYLLHTCCHNWPGGRFKNVYELLTLRALKISVLYKIHISQCMGKIFCVEFQRVPLKFHTKYRVHTLKYTDFIHRWKSKGS